jgi:hypothetical protein
MSSEYDDLKRRVEKLEGELAEAKKSLDGVKPVEQVPKSEKPWPKYDPTEGFRLPPSAAKAMADVVPDPKPSAGFNAHSWAQNKGPGEPGGFGAPTKPGGPGEVQRGSGWRDPAPLSQPPGVRWMTMSERPPSTKAFNFVVDGDGDG